MLSLFETCANKIHYFHLECIKDLKLLNLPPLIFDYFLEREHSWGDQDQFQGLPVHFSCNCISPAYSLTLEQYKLAVYNLDSVPCTGSLQLSPLPLAKGVLCNDNVGRNVG